MKSYIELNPNQLDFSRVAENHRELRIQQFKDWREGRLDSRVTEAYGHWLERAIDADEVTFVGPGLLKKIVNLSRAVVAQVTLKDPVKLVPEEVYAARLAQCDQNTCGMFDKKKVKCLHPKCGCGLQIKARWASQYCPVNLWKD